MIKPRFRGFFITDVPLYYHSHDLIKIKPLIGAYLYKVMMWYRDKLLFLT